MVKKAKKASSATKSSATRRKAGPWKEAIKQYGLFEGKETFIAIICRSELCPHCKNGELVTPLKWKVAVKKGNNWAVVAEHPLSCDADIAFGKYGRPSEFAKNCGYVGENDAMKPDKDVDFYD